MTRRFLSFLAGLLALCGSLRADTTNMATFTASVLENDVAYLRVGEVGENLADEIQSAQNILAATNKISGTVLDLRFAGGDDLAAAKAAANLFTAKKLPLAILVNGETRGAALALATTLRAARDGLVFGSTAAAGGSGVPTNSPKNLRSESSSWFRMSPTVDDLGWGRKFRSSGAKQRQTEMTLSVSLAYVSSRCWKSGLLARGTSCEGMATKS